MENFELRFAKYNPLHSQRITSLIVFGSPNLVSESSRLNLPSNLDVSIMDNRHSSTPDLTPRTHSPLSPPLSQPQPQTDSPPLSQSPPQTNSPPLSPSPPPPQTDSPLSPSPPLSQLPPLSPSLPLSPSPPSFFPPDDDEHESESDDDLRAKIFGSASTNVLKSLQEQIGSAKTLIQKKLEQLHTQTQTLTQNVTQLLMQKQYDTASYRLPVVIKEIQSTPGTLPPKGLFYINRKGRKIYLNDSQRRRWLQGDEIAGCIKGCSSHELP